MVEDDVTVLVDVMLDDVVDELDVDELDAEDVVVDDAVVDELLDEVDVVVVVAGVDSTICSAKKRLRGVPSEAEPPPACSVKSDPVRPRNTT